MKATSTQISLAKDGSTTPVVSQQQLAKEAADIRSLWHRHGCHHVTSQLRDTNTLHRHKSLLLNLILEEYDKDKQGPHSSIQLEEYCQRYLGLGESLERSIYRQLEVREYLDHHPELLQLEGGFNWPEPGETFLNFAVLEELGHGALAKVYLCKQQNLADRLVVVKIALGAKVNEATLLGKLRHPHIMPVLWADYDQAADASYLCMPFVGRSTLIDLIEMAFRNSRRRDSNVILEAARLWASPHELEEFETAPVRAKQLGGRSSYVTGVLRLAADLADGLAWAHRQNVIHGDIKPSNVLLTPDGTPLLFDFNLGRDRLRTDGPAGGTLAYMAPEQLHCLANDCADSFPPPEIATDIYSFGVLLCELLTGRPPFEIEDEPLDAKVAAEQLYAQQQAFSPKALSSSSEVDDRLCQLVLDCLAFEPSERPDSMADVRNRLMEQLTVSARGWRIAKAHPWRALLVGATLGAALIFGGVFYSTRPTLAESLMNDAIAAQRAGDWKKGILLFSEVLAIDPASRSARMYRGRCYLGLDDYASAGTEFLQIIQDHNDPNAMALLAYSTNLAGNPEVANMWYQAAMHDGLTTVGLLNNFAASLLEGQSDQPLLARIAQSKALLLRALEREPNSAVIRMNLVRLAKMELAQRSTRSAEIATDNIAWLCRHLPKSSEVWLAGFVTYHSLAEMKLATYSEALEFLQRAEELGGGPSAGQLKSGLRYTVYRDLPDFDAVVRSAARRPANISAPQPIGKYLDPLTTEVVH